MSSFQPGETLILEGFLSVKFVRDIADTTDCIVQVGADTKSVSEFALSR